MDETLDEEPEEEALPLWRRLSLRHLGLLLATVGLGALGWGAWLYFEPAQLPEQAAPEAALAGEMLDGASAPDGSASAAMPEAASAPEAAAEPEQHEAASAGSAKKAKDSELLTVYVVGAVAAPGVYQVPAGGRVNDAIGSAGGLSDDADGLRINLAQPLADGQQLYVPHQGEEPAALPASTVAASNAAAPAAAEQGGLLNINTASAKEFEALPRIGPALAQRIVEHRTAKGAFASIEGLREVKGVSESVYNALASLITVN